MLLSAIDTSFYALVSVIVVVVLLLRGMVGLILWSKRMPKGAYIFLAIFPLISIFPIPGQEVKKLENIKQVKIKSEDESGEPKDDDIA